jgi:hypothetical protein
MVSCPLSRVIALLDAVEGTYTMILRPRIDRLAESVGG